MPRPSSPPSAKASVRSPYALDRSQQNPCAGKKPPIRRPTSIRPRLGFVARQCFSSRSALQGLGVPGESFFHDVKSTCDPRIDVKSVLSPIARFGGARRDRTDDLMLAKHALYQLSYGPKLGSPIRSVVVDRGPSPWQESLVGLGRLELPTLRLSGVRSNHLSYRPMPHRSGVAPAYEGDCCLATALGARDRIA